jgi:antitoxin CptB
MSFPDASARPASHATAALDARRLARIRWRARRGMLENDLVLARFLDRRGADLTEAEIAALDRLLDLPDNELWDLICGRACADAALQPVLRELSIS